jgi:hypothetical protein
MKLIASLRETRRSLDLGELIAMNTPRARFEGYDDLRDERGDIRRFRVYSVEGCLFDGQPIIVPAALSALAADSLAHDGIMTTIQRGQLALASLDSEVDRNMDVRPSDSDGLSGEQRAKIERMLADK